MVNVNFDKFIKTQNKHKSENLGKNEKRDETHTGDPNYNSQEETDIAPGAEGR